MRGSESVESSTVITGVDIDVCSTVVCGFNNPTWEICSFSAWKSSLTCSYCVLDGSWALRARLGMPRSDLKRSEARKHVLRAKNHDFPSKSHWNPLQIAYRMPIGNIGNFPKSHPRKHFRKWPCRWSWELSSRFLATHSIPKNCTEAILKFFSVRKVFWVGKWWFPMKTPM